MVVLVMGGILAAIALPTFLSRANSAKQAEAKMFVGTLNRAQQAYFTEHYKFTDDLGRLGVAQTESTNYQYEIKMDGSGSAYAIQHASSKLAKLHSYVGMTAITNTAQGSAMQTLLCESELPTVGKVADPVYNATSIECSPGSKRVN
jgi:type II secretory pathway pseudopilin PulG